MSTKHKKQPEKPLTEEIEWTDEDDAIMDTVYAKLRAKGVTGGPLPGTPEWDARPGKPVPPTSKNTDTSSKKH